MIRIVLADDHPVVRTGIRALLDSEPDIDIVGEASTAEDAVTLVGNGPCDLVLMDLQFTAHPSAGMHGAQATQQIRAQADPPYVLILTNYDTDADILAAVEAGASGYLLKDAPPDELLAAIRAAAEGQSALAPAVTARLLDRMRQPVTRLSGRELQVLEELAGGLSNDQIAAQLVVSITTVKTHLGHIYDKLDVSSRTAAVETARRQGLIR